MPVYDYRCASCGAKREVYVAPSPEIPQVMEFRCPMADGDGAPCATLCPHERQVSAPHVVIPKQHRAA